MGLFAKVGDLNSRVGMVKVPRVDVPSSQDPWDPLAAGPPSKPVFDLRNTSKLRPTGPAGVDQRLLLESLNPFKVGQERKMCVLAEERSGETVWMITSPQRGSRKPY